MNLNIYIRRLSGLLLASAMLFASTPQSAKAAGSEASASAKLTSVKEIVAAPGFWGGSAFALGKDGTVWSWGSNYSGQFANGAAGPAGWTNAAHKVEGLEGTKRLAIGSHYYMALGLDGNVKVWGAFLRTGGWSAAAAKGDQWTIPLPEAVDGLTGIAEIAAGENMALALRKDGGVMAWLAPSASPDNSDRLPSASLLPGLSGTAAIYGGGGNLFAAVKNDGTLWLVTKAGTEEGRVPVKLSGPENVQAVAIRDGGIIALAKNGTVWAPLSKEDAVLHRLRQAPGLSGIVSVQTGSGFNLVKNVKGEYWLWETDTNLKSLQKVTALSGISRLTLEFGGFAAVKKDGSLWMWKRDISIGKLSFTKPRQMKGVIRPVSFAAGENSKYAVLADGTAAAWGTNKFGQLGIGVNESRPFTASPIIKPVSLRVGGTLLNPVQPPIYLDGQVYVPLRAVTEGLGYTVGAGTSESITLTGHGKSVTLPVAGIFKVGYTQLIPAGALAQSLGASVKWDSGSYEIVFEQKNV